MFFVRDSNHVEAADRSTGPPDSITAITRSITLWNGCNSIESIWRLSGCQRAHAIASASPTEKCSSWRLFLASLRSASITVAW